MAIHKNLDNLTDFIDDMDDDELEVLKDDIRDLDRDEMAGKWDNDENIMSVFDAYFEKHRRGKEIEGFSVILQCGVDLWLDGKYGGTFFPDAGLEQLCLEQMKSLRQSDPAKFAQAKQLLTQAIFCEKKDQQAAFFALLGLDE